MKRLLSLALILPTAALAHSGHDHGSVGGGFAHPLGGADHVLAMVALGLLAAIPAVVLYNKLSADSDRLTGNYESFADEFSTILSRQLDDA